ncbi:MAG TPA: hypothetical protein ENF42_01180 [Candidatus Bathyarchaeota archaeon]|nr:hypothetical protein [Candidatus Bathyarchaeota archaeon]
MDRDELRKWIIEAVDNVLSTSFFTIVEPIIDGSPQAIEPKSGPIFHAWVELTEAENAIKIDLFFTSPFLNKITLDFLGIEEGTKLSNQDLTDMAEEIANIVAGEMVGKLGEKWLISLPTSKMETETTIAEGEVVICLTDMEGDVFFIALS